MDIIHIPAWGCSVALDADGSLLSVPTNADGTVYNDCEPAHVELVCEHFLADVNAALGTAFVAGDFPIVSCEGHGPVTP